MRVALLLFTIAGCLTAQNTDPMKAQLVTSDIPHFWAVLDKPSLQNAANLFQQEYFDNGSEGLKTFVKVRINNARNLAAVVAARPGISLRFGRIRCARPESRCQGGH
jgi:hypothetical protein